jgi:SAM-dependent methyltransferase
MAFDRADFYDAELRRHNEHFRAALEINPKDRVLDIGCGAGQSTRETARLAARGSVLGVDVSEDLLRVACQRSADEGLGNVTFELGDAQTKAFPAAHFDACISRFGVMFFADPVAAFANIGRAMRPGARLVLLVWQAEDRNEWATAIPNALAPKRVSPAAAAFSLADPSVTTGVLTAAGFASVDFVDVHEPVFYGRTVEAAYEAVVSFFVGQGKLIGSESDDALQRLRGLLEAHLTPEGVLFDSRAWIVTARKA